MIGIEPLLAGSARVPLFRAFNLVGFRECPVGNVDSFLFCVKLLIVDVKVLREGITFLVEDRKLLPLGVGGTGSL